ncbi:MAG TPA: hypothetical protein VFZ76_11195, partial [Anaerolineales bacterium]
VWAGLAPYAEKLIFEQSGDQRYPWLGELVDLIRNLLTYPRQVVGILEKLERGDLAVQVPQLTAEVENLEHTVDKMAGGLVFAALLLGGVQVYLAGETGLAVVLMAAAGLTLVWILFRR